MRISDWSSDVCSSDLRFSLEDAKPDLNLVEPAGAGGREVKGDVRMRGEPVLVFLAGAQVVQDDVDLPVSGLVGNDLVHEGLTVGLLLGLGGLAADDARGNLQRRQKVARAVELGGALRDRDRLAAACLHASDERGWR